METSPFFLNSRTNGLSVWGFCAKAFAVFVLITGFLWTAQNAFATDFQGISTVVDSTHLDFSPSSSVYPLTGGGGGSCASQAGQVAISAHDVYSSAYPSTASSVGGGTLFQNWSYFSSYDFSSLADGSYWVRFSFATIDSSCVTTLNGDIVYVLFDILSGEVVPNNPIENDITPLSPADSATDVNAYINFTGTYTNDGEHDRVVLTINTPDIGAVIKTCQTALVGEDLSYSCYFSGLTNSEYGYYPMLCSIADAGSFPLGCHIHTPEVTFTTGSVYQVSTPPVSANCSSFDVGCYLENAIGWTFSIEPSTLEQFSDLTLENSWPFSYVYDMQNLFMNLFANDGDMEFAVSAPTPLGEIEFISADAISAVPYTGTIKNILTWLLYFFTAMTIYRMLLRIHNSNA